MRLSVCSLNFLVHALQLVALWEGWEGLEPPSELSLLHPLV